MKHCDPSPKKYTPAWKEKISRGMVRAHAEKRAGGFGPGNRAGALLPKETRQKVVEAAVARTRGSGGFGKMQGGQEDHQFAKRWILETPDGEIVEIANLREWCRENVNLFATARPGRLPAWDRAAAGIRAAAPGNRYGRTQWRGWRVLAVVGE
jgi:hypothetical protein